MSSSKRNVKKVVAQITCKFCGKYVSLDGAGMHLSMYHGDVARKIDHDMDHKEYAIRSLYEGYNA